MFNEEMCIHVHITSDRIAQNWWAPQGLQAAGDLGYSSHHNKDAQAQVSQLVPLSCCSTAAWRGFVVAA